MDRLKRFIDKQNRVELLKYTFASSIALIIDYSCYWLLVTNNILDLPKSAVVGYIAGLFFAYFLISGIVFKKGWLKNRKCIEAFLFFISGLLGIALTYISVNIVTFIFGERINVAKISAVIVSFIGVYLFRKIIIFKI